MTATVLGVGNVLMGDEGVGVRAAEALRGRVPDGVRVVEAGALGLELLAEFEAASRLLILDCVDAGMPAGRVLRLRDAGITGSPRPNSPHLSPHELGVGDLLSLAALHSKAPEEVVVLGVQPASVAPGLELSPEVAAALPRLVREALGIITRWGTSG